MYIADFFCLHAPCSISGCQDGVIHHHDVRKAEHIVAQSRHHRLEVCGLKWSPDGTKLASGGNDNLVCIWNANNPSEPSQVLRGHQAAVKVGHPLSLNLHTVFSPYPFTAGLLQCDWL